MSATTTNYGLVKPAGADRVNIGIIDGNFDVIDAQMALLVPPSGTHIRYVSTDARASNSNSGLSWAAPLATYEAAVTSLGSNAGVICLGPGTHTVTSTVTLVDGTKTIGCGQRVSILSKTTSGAMFVNSGAQSGNWEFSSLRFSVTAAPVFSGSYALSSWRGCAFVQTNVDQPIFDVTAFTFNRFDDDCNFDHSTSATVPSFRGISTTNDLNENLFRGVWRSTGNYAIWLEEQGGAYSAGNRIECSFEIPNGGCVKLLSAGSTSIRSSVWDMGTSTKDLFVVSKSAAGGAVASRFTTLEVHRYGGALGSGLVDIKVVSPSLCTLITNSDRPSSGFTIDMGQCGGTIINSAAATLQNATACGVLGNLGVYSPPSGATGLLGAASSCRVGSMFFNTTVGKPTWSNGTHWVDAAGTTVE